jgi:hypothetical protein
MSPDDKFKTALEIRNMEIKLFWDRSNFFLALNTAVAVGFFSLEDKNLTLPLAGLGLLASALWFAANLGSKFWQARWEEKVSEVEKQHVPDLVFFTEDYEAIRKSVERNLMRQSRGCLARIVIRMILKKPSLSMLAIFLSLGFCALWLLFIAQLLWGVIYG